MPILQEVGIQEMLWMQTIFTPEPDMSSGMLAVPFIGRASYKQRLLCLLLRPNTMCYLRLWGRLCLWLIWWRKLMWFSLFTYRCQGLLSRSENIISHVLQWQTIPSSLQVQGILQSNIITFASMSLRIPIRMVLSRLTIAQQMIKLQIFLQNLFTMIFSFG